MDISAFTDRVNIGKGIGYFSKQGEDKVYTGASPSDDRLVEIYKSALEEMCSIETAPTKRDGERTVVFDGGRSAFAEFVVTDGRSGATARLRLFYRTDEKYVTSLILLPGGHNMKVNGRTDIGEQVAKIIAHLRKPDTNKSKHSTRTLRIAAAQDEKNPAYNPEIANS